VGIVFFGNGVRLCSYFIPELRERIYIRRHGISGIKNIDVITERDITTSIERETKKAENVMEGTMKTYSSPEELSSDLGIDLKNLKCFKS